MKINIVRNEASCFFKVHILFLKYNGILLNKVFLTGMQDEKITKMLTIVCRLIIIKKYNLRHVNWYWLSVYGKRVIRKSTD